MTRQISFSVDVDDDDPTVVICPEGEFDAAQVDLFDSTTAPFRAVPSVVVDLARTTLLDSSAIGSLLRLHRDVTTAGGTCVVHARKPFQRELFAVTGLEYLLADEDTP